VWLNGPEGHGLFRGREDHPHPELAEAITADLLRAAGVTVTGVDIDDLEPALTAGPRRGRDTAQAAGRIQFTAAATAEPRQMTVRIGYALGHGRRHRRADPGDRPADGPARGPRPQ
jgi:hypothetical protein